MLLVLSHGAHQPLLKVKELSDEQGGAIAAAARTFKYTWGTAKSLSCFGSGSWKPFDSGQLPGPRRSSRAVAQRCLGDMCLGMGQLARGV